MEFKGFLGHLGVMEQILPKGYKLNDDLQKVDFERVTRWLAGTYWSPGIGREEVQRGAGNSSLVIGAYTSEGHQVGYARVISDKTRIGYFLDVYVEEPHRNNGLAQAMIRFAMEHPDFKLVYVWLLATRTAHGVYEKVGFKPLDHPERWMIINKGRPGGSTEVSGR